MSSARTLGELRQGAFTAQRLSSRRVKDELRENLMSRLREGGSIFPHRRIRRHGGASDRECDPLAA